MSAVEKARRLGEEATPGPWYREGGQVDVGGTSFYLDPEDAALVVAARNAWDVIWDAIEAAQEHRGEVDPTCPCRLCSALAELDRVFGEER